MKIRAQIVNPASGGTPFGQMQAGPEVIDYIKDKKAQEENLAQLRLGAYLIDTKDPTSQEKAYTIFPELRDYPEQYHAQNLAIQEALRTMLRDGTIRGKEDNALIFCMIQDDFVLPMEPVWDPDGLIMNQARATKTFWNLQTKGISRGMFSPSRWGVNSKEMEGQSKEYTELQRSIKKMILKRLYPGLREHNDKTLDSFIQKISGITNAPTTDDEFGLLKSVWAGVSTPSGGAPKDTVKRGKFGGYTPFTDGNDKGIAAGTSGGAAGRYYQNEAYRTKILSGLP